MGMDDVQGVMFDMDNTLVASRIDYAGMKGAVHRYLATRGVLPETMDLAPHTTSTLIAEALATGWRDEDGIRGMWAVVTHHEIAGMQGAGLEPGAKDVLEALYGEVRLAVVTNNSFAAAEEALGRNRILHLFDCVVAREQMAAAKPAPDGYVAVLARFPDAPAANWLAVGDSWIDGKAAEAAGIRYAAYRADAASLANHGVAPAAWLDDLRALLELIKR